MKIELKNIKHHTRLSEETNAFSGVLYIDGKRVADASNCGHGEPARLMPFEGQRATLDQVEARLAARDKMDVGHDLFITPDLDFIVSMMVSTDLLRKTVKQDTKRMAGPKATKTRVLLRDTGTIMAAPIDPHKTRTDNGVKGPAHELLVAQMKRTGHDPICLNTLYERDPQAVVRELVKNEGLVEEYDWTPEKLLGELVG
jgi:hypothetical protein